MSRYRRIVPPGASHFFTLCLAQRGQTLLTDDVARLRHAYTATLRNYPLHTDAIVILPDHLHAVWTLPEGDADYPTRWRLIKTAFSKGHAPSALTSQSKRDRGEKGIWQRRYWHHLIRSEADLAAHIAYCWGNPVKHGLVERAVDWPYSSLHRDISWEAFHQSGRVTYLTAISAHKLLFRRVGETHAVLTANAVFEERRGFHPPYACCFTAISGWERFRQIGWVTYLTAISANKLLFRRVGETHADLTANAVFEESRGFHPPYAC